MSVTWLLIRYPSHSVAAQTILWHPTTPSIPHLQGSPREMVVHVATDKLTHETAEAIAVSIRNGLDQAVRASNQYSYCTIVTLERKQGDTWELVTPCALLRMAATIDIEPGETTRLWLPPSEHPEPRPQAGTYRIAFHYQVLDRERVKHLSAESVHSESFTVRKD